MPKILLQPSGKEHDQHLGDDHTDEHTQRIDRGIADAGCFTLQGVVGITQGHRVGHASTKDATNGAIVKLLGFQCYDTYKEYRQEREQEAQPYPQKPFRTEDGLEELAAGIESQASQIERKTEFAQHETGTAGHIGYEMYARAQCSHHNTHHDGTAGNAQSHGNGHAGNIDGNGADGQTEQHTEEDGSEVGLVERAHGITEEVFQLRKKLSSEKSKNSVLLARIAELTRLKQVEKELNELKARLKDFEFYKNIHDFLKQRTRNFDEFIQQVDRWARKNKEPAQQKQLNRRQNGPER